MAFRRSGDVGTLDNNKHLCSPLPNRSHIARQARRLHCRILIVVVLLIYKLNLVSTLFSLMKQTDNDTTTFALGLRYKIIHESAL